MENGKEINNSLVSIEIPKSIDNAAMNLTDKPTQMIGQVLSDCLFLVFGGLSQKAEIKRIEYSIGLKYFTKEFEKKYEKIPENKRLNPNIHTVCTVLDNMKYCVEEPSLRELFENLIVNSINEDTVDVVHPSYGEIVRQLTAFDAKVILWLNEHNDIPLIRFRIVDNKEECYLQKTQVFLEEDFGNLDFLQLSLDNLLRLRIIEFVLDKEYSDDSVFDNIRKTQSYILFKEELERGARENQEVVESYGEINITFYGKRFLEACNSVE